MSLKNKCCANDSKSYWHTYRKADSIDMGIHYVEHEKRLHGMMRFHKACISPKRSSAEWKLGEKKNLLSFQKFWSFWEITYFEAKRSLVTTYNYANKQLLPSSY